MTDHPPAPAPEPPLELIEKWRTMAPLARDAGATRERWIATQAWQHAAHLMLEACCDKVELWHHDGNRLRAAFRPRPAALHEQALQDLQDLVSNLEIYGHALATDRLRRALERLAELEALTDG